MDEGSPRRPIRVLILLEGTTVSGPARNVLEFCTVSRGMDRPPAVTLAGFVRPSGNNLASNDLFAGARAAGVAMEPIQEGFPFDVRVLPAIRSLVQRVQPDIIETHHVKSHFLLRLSGAGRRHAWIAFHHGYTRDATRTLLYDQLDRWSLQAPTRIVTVCQPFQRQLVKIGVPPQHITVLHNAISADWLTGSATVAGTGLAAAASRPAKPSGAERMVLAVGRLSREKAFTDLVTAMDEVRQLCPNLPVRLFIAGDGPEKDRIQQRAQQLQVQDRVVLLGHVHDLRSYYLAADVVAISSLSEGSPNVLLEAMAAGTPVVATAVGGIPEMVCHNRTALLVEPASPGKIAAAIALLLSESGLWQSISANAQEMVRTHYSPQARAQSLLQLYASVLPLR